MARLPAAILLPAWLTFAVIAEEAVRRLLRLALVKRRTVRTTPSAPQYDGLESLVSFSACLIAASRAFETEQAEPYILDLLAGGLCGQEALDARRGSNRQAAVSAAPAAPTEQQLTSSQLRPIPRLIMRTRFFDDVVSVVTWRGEGTSAAAAAHSCHAQLLETCGRAAPCMQVVMLGSGLDARPWRLALPHGVRWFEVDRHDVLAAKQSRLQALGAELAAPAAAQQPQQQVGQGAEEQAEGRQQEEQHLQLLGEVRSAGSRYPLRAASWRCCAVDLQQRGWSQGLVERGLDPRAPVLWVLEGLLYYLEEADVRALLKEAASISASGSILTASVIRAPQDQATEGAIAGPAPAAPAPAAGPTTPAESGGRVSGSAAAAGSGSAPQGEGRPSYKLNNEFKWKCREEIPTFFGDCGWGALASLSWLEAAKSYGLPTGDASASSVYFLTAQLVEAR